MLRRNGEVVAATPKVRATLLVLVRARGKPVSKEDLLAAVWPDSFVEEGNLTQNISVLRKLLAIDYPNESPIVTISKVGYRFSAPVGLHRDAAEDGDDFLSPASPGNEDGEAAENGSETVAPIGEAPHAFRSASQDPSQGVLSAAPPPVKHRAFHPSRWMFSVLAALSLLAFALLYAGHLRSAEKPKLELVRFTANTNENRVTAAAISPDGTLVAYADADGVVLRGEHDIATHSVRTPEVRQVERLAWSPDGRHILMSGSGGSGIQQLWMLSTTGDAPTLLKDHARLGTISPDGSTVAFVTDTRSEVWVEGRAGDNPRRVFSGSPADTFPEVLWSADGRRLLLQRHTAFQSDGHFHSPRTEDEIEGFHSAYLAVDVGSGRIMASEDGIRIGGACLLAAGRLLFSRAEETDYGDGTSLWKVAVDPHTGDFVSAPEKIRDFESMRLLTLSVAAHTGAVAAVFSHGTPGIYVGSLHLGTNTLDHVKLLTSGHGGPHAWTSDSVAVLFESNLVDLHHYHIYKQELTRHEPEALAADMGGEVLPRMTPDPRYILFETRAKDGTISIWRLALAGGQPILIDQGRSDEYRCPLFGSYCVLGTPLDTQRFAFWVLDSVHGKGKQLCTIPASWKAHGDWDVSPDGSQVVVVSPDSTQPEIRAVELASGKTQEILVAIQSPVRAINALPNGKGWIVATSTALGNELLDVDANGKPSLLRETATYTWGVPSPDGTKLAFADQDMDSNVWLLSVGQ